MYHESLQRHFSIVSRFILNAGGLHFQMNEFQFFVVNEEFLQILSLPFFDFAAVFLCIKMFSCNDSLSFLFLFF